MKKVLIITYHWPPSGGITVLRCLKFVKYLREFGWEPVVFTAKNASYQYLDYSNEKDIPDGIEIHKVPIFEPINLFKKLTGRKKDQPVQNITSNSAKKRSVLDTFSIWIRGNFFIPDARKAWIRPSVKYLRKYLQENKIDAILTDGPPHTNTVIGLRLAQEFGIPWLADFQDPWTQVDYYDKLHIGKRADRKHKKLEQDVFRTAKKITIASPTWKKNLEKIGAKDVSVIFYGYDEEDFKDYNILTNEKFIIFHGGLLGEDRNPTGFIQALKSLVEIHPELKSKIELRLAGEVDYSVRQLIDQYSLTEHTVYLGMIPRSEIFIEYAKASLLLLPINKAANAAGRIPGKLFEMLRSGQKILVLGPSDGDVKKIVDDGKFGISFEYEQKKEIEAFLKEVFVIDNGVNKLETQGNYLEFSNKIITQKIGKLLDEITTN